MEVTLYTFEDGDGIEQTFTTFIAVEAQETARQNRWRVIAVEFEYSDSHPVPEWDFTPKSE
jgi:hypothetical protein